MAGGMNKRGVYGSMAERVARSRPGPEQVPEPAAATAPAGEAPLKHCWVVDGADRLPALLLEWRRVEGEWRGRVVRPVRDGAGWVVVEEWLPAALLSAAG
ncbi:hypothetical protein ACFP3Q_11940 [Nocardioides sp. GCM10027113]|uniref:hypothetical protein n=1 Tax=unclassified Nocardioides TaxID=2615069 RepID=UPI003616968C